MIQYMAKEEGLRRKMSRGREHASFTPLVMSVTGGLGKIATVTYKRLALYKNGTNPTAELWAGYTASSGSPYFVLPSSAFEGPNPHVAILQVPHDFH